MITNEYSGLADAWSTYIQPPPIVNEYRVYYDASGTVTFCDGPSGPSGNYICAQVAEVVKVMVGLTVVHNGSLTIPESNSLSIRLIKSMTGFQSVRAHPALLIEPNDTYTDTEYYDRAN